MTRDEDGRVVEVYATGDNKYSLIIFDEDGPRTIEFDRDGAIRFARALYIASLDAETP